MDKFFQDEFRVNMGHKKELTKDQLLAKYKEEGIKREIERKQAEAAKTFTKYYRSFKSNKTLANQIFNDPSLKLRETIMVLKAATVK